MKSVDPNNEGFPLQNLFNANIICRRYEGCMYVCIKYSNYLVYQLLQM